MPRREGKRFDVLLIDISLRAEEDGVAFLRQLRETGASTGAGAGAFTVRALSSV